MCTSRALIGKEIRAIEHDWNAGYVEGDSLKFIYECPGYNAWARAHSLAQFRSVLTFRALRDFSARGVSLCPDMRRAQFAPLFFFFFSSSFVRIRFFLFLMRARAHAPAFSRKQECRAPVRRSREDEKVDAACATHRYAIS